MRAAKSIRRLAVGALLSLSMAGCFESEDIGVAVVGAQYDGARDQCRVEVEVTNNLQEPIELISIWPYMNGTKPRDNFGTVVRLSDVKVGEVKRRTAVYDDPDGSICRDPEITKIDTGYDCKTATRICNEDISF
jgi:hypothetical protein